jgi:hypothetical protein
MLHNNHLLHFSLDVGKKLQDRAGCSCGRKPRSIASIVSPHIGAHSFEASYFAGRSRRPCARARRIRTAIVIERDIYAKATEQLKESSDNLRHMIQKLGRFTEGSWRAEQTLTALAAWLALC